MVWEGKDVIDRAQKICGYTNPGKLSGHFRIEKAGKRHICHCSDNVPRANEEIKLWFDKEEILSWPTKTEEKVWVLSGTKSELDEENTPDRVIPMGENIFDDVNGEFTLTNYDFLMDRYHNRMGKLHIDADGPWEETPFKRSKNKIVRGIEDQVKQFFEFAGKNPEEDELNRYDIEGILIKVTRKHGYFDTWSHKEFN
jgi:hypothetical protein